MKISKLTLALLSAFATSALLAPAAQASSLTAVSAPGYLSIAKLNNHGYVLADRDDDDDHDGDDDDDDDDDHDGDDDDHDCRRGHDCGD